ncbi:Na(+), Li(+), K(+)/H(+) antiporter [Paenibacillus allorhizoplanae]|uniref:Na(+), Li(+), K(+)/H(+) antiporter n=1 Tax=Paenibacillus allorhizoplanae TaxID=2905648 RepID=A0ABN8G4G5_9BACL|nr:MFS transporter [Paenibacillus allorhizoplanae]CAH1199726.1 Na(+), Li(+), K(+)/H(+) antiporter [Paenibacillus allorhizoplanae]
MNRMRQFLQAYHPIVHTLILGTVMARAASSMSLPFLAIYLAKHSDMSPGLIGIVIGMGALAGTFGGFIGGTLSDRFGRRVIMLAALFGWGFVFLGFGVVKLPVLFMLLNMLNGLCRSFYEPVSQALMADLTEPSKRRQVFSLRYMAINVGVAVGPLLGAFFATMNGALPFLLTGIIYLIYGITLYALLIKFGIKKIEGEKKSIVTFRSAIGVIRKDITFRLYIIGGIIGAIGYSQVMVTLSQYLQRDFANGVKMFAILMSANAIVVIAMQVPLGRWAEKYSPLTAIVVGNFMFALGDIGFAFSHTLAWLIVSMGIFTFGEILNYPAANMLIDKLAPEHMRGTYYGAQTLTNIGHFMGPWVGGFLLVSYGGSTLFLVIAILSMMGSIFYWRGTKRRNTAKISSKMQIF